MKKFKLSLILMLICLMKLFSQEVHIVTDDAKIYKLLPNGNLEHKVTVEAFTNSSTKQIQDIGISPSNELYGVTQDNGIFEIIEIDWLTGEYELLTEIPNFVSSLVCKNDEELLFIDFTQRLYKYSISSNVIEEIAFLGYVTPGDLCFYRGNVIFPTNHEIKAYNLETESISTIFCFPEYTEYYGISMIYSECDSNKILVPVFGPMDNLEFLTLDLETKSSTIHSTNNSFSESVYGMASSMEYSGYECDLYEFEDIECTELTSIGGIESQISISVYPNPFHEYLIIEGCQDIRNIKVYNNKGENVIFTIENENVLNLNHLSFGIYYLIIKCGDEKIVKKIFKN